MVGLFVKKLALLKSAAPLALALLVIVGAYAGAKRPNGAKPAEQVPWVGSMGITETTDQIMAREWERAATEAIPSVIEQPANLYSKPEMELPDRRNLPQNSRSRRVSQWPLAAAGAASKGAQPTKGPDRNPTPRNPQTIGTSFDGISLGETSVVPPDSMGGVGPTNVVVCSNNRIKSFSRAGALGSLNADLDVFFASVANGAGHSDPRVKFDRLSQRWFVLAINLQGGGNRVMIAVSNTANITGATVWTFFFFKQDTVAPAGNPGEFLDYPSLGVDNNALYIGGMMFGGSFTGTSGWVVRKSSVLGAGPIVVTAFRGLSGAGGTGVFAPQGVDNFDSAATEGYFIGVDTATFGTLVMRRVSTPGGTPTISGNILLAVPATSFPQLTPHMGSATPLDALDDRLFAASMHKNTLTGVSTLWTAHNIEVDATGVASGTGNRNGSRWYEIQNMTGVPSLRQSGTLFHNAGANIDNYWIPSVAMSGQGHMAIAASVAGTARSPGIAAAGRLSADALGSTQAPTVAANAGGAYNVQGGGSQRWGDYSMTVVDPNDNMTMWTFQEYCNSTNSWMVRATQLRAPAPAAINAPASPTLVRNTSGVNVAITGTSSAGTGFYDGGSAFPNRIAASVSGAGVTVNSVTFTNPTSLTLNLTIANNAALGNRNLTITNPDGQFATRTNAFMVINPAPTTTGLVPNNTNAGGPAFSLQVNGTGFVPESTATWNGSNRTTTFVSPTRVDAQITLADIAVAGSALVRVVNVAPGGGTSNSQTFTINGAGPITVNPTLHTMILGIVMSGPLANLFTSDDLKVSINNDEETPEAQIEVETTSPLASVSQLQFVCEASTSRDDSSQQIQLFNWTTTSWEQVDLRAATVTDSTVTVTITTSPNRFIQPGTRLMRGRVGHSPANEVSAFDGWASVFDWIVWILLP